MKWYLIALVILYGCTLGVPFYDRPPGSFFPTGRGTWWNYDVSREDFLSDTIIDSRLTIVVISSEENPDGEIVSRWGMSCPDSIVMALLFHTGSGALLDLHQTPDSAWFSHPDRDSITTWLLRFPLAVGNTWQWFPNFDYYARVDSMARLYTLAGVFDSCYRVNVNGGWWQSPEEMRYWYRPSIGLIEADFEEAPLIPRRFSLRLRSYFINHFGPS